MKWMKKIASGALALLMAASLTACGGDTSWAYRSENATVTSGMYVGLSIQALNSAFAVDAMIPGRNLVIIPQNASNINPIKPVI